MGKRFCGVISAAGFLLLIGTAGASDQDLIPLSHTMMFQLNAKLGGSYSKAFKQAVQELESMQKEIQELSKMQADISAFQKQQAAAEATRKRLEMLRQQYRHTCPSARTYCPNHWGQM